MMKNNNTELVFILDRSGSMAGFEEDTVGGFNATVEKQRGEDGEVFVSTVLFSNESEVLHDRVDIRKLSPLTRREYRVGGCTALLDAIGDAIRHIGNIHKYARPEDVPAHTVFVITTDGMENASCRYTGEEVRAMIRRQTEKYGWEFLFLAADIDTATAADSLGIRRDRAATYRKTREGIERSYSAAGEAIAAVRACRADAFSLEDYLKEDGEDA